MKNIIILISLLFMFGCSKEYPAQIITPNPIISIYQLKDLAYNDYVFITLDNDSNIIYKTTSDTYRWNRYSNRYGYYTISNEDLYENTYVTNIIIKQQFDSIRVGNPITDSMYKANIINTPYSKYSEIIDLSINWSVESIRDSLNTGSLFKYCKTLK